MLVRHWSELKPWNARSPEDDAAVREFRAGPAPQSPVEPPEHTAEAGGTAEERGGVGGVLPLDDDVRFGGEAA